MTWHRDLHHFWFVVNEPEYHLLLRVFCKLESMVPFRATISLGLVHAQSIRNILLQLLLTLGLSQKMFTLLLY